MQQYLEDQDKRDLELQRGIQQAFDDYKQANSAERPHARDRYLKLLFDFSTRISQRQPLYPSD